MIRLDLQTIYLPKFETKIYSNRSFLALKCVEIPTSAMRNFFFFFSKQLTEIVLQKFQLCFRPKK